jgi:tetratricopeptide (TPR) repeat protein
MERGSGGKKGRAGRRVAKEPQDTATYSTQALIKKAEELIEECNYQLAQRFYDRALKQEPDNTRVRFLSYSVLISFINRNLGDCDYEGN